MRRGEGALLATVLAVGLVVVPATTAAATCSCDPPPVTKTLARELVAQEVFTGRVTATAPLRDGVRRLDVAVDEVFLGEVGATISVEASTAEPPCGFDPPVGSDVLLYTVRGSADRGRDQSDATAVLPCVGGRDGSEASALRDDRAPPTGLLVGGVAVVLLGVGAAVVVGRRARRRGAT